VYKSIVFGTPAPSVLLKWGMMERFGWTENEYKRLSVASLHEYLEIEDGKATARKSVIKR
jgi:hypothetical protein